MDMPRATRAVIFTTPSVSHRATFSRAGLLTRRVPCRAVSHAPVLVCSTRRAPCRTVSHAAALVRAPPAAFRAALVHHPSPLRAALLHALRLRPAPHTVRPQHDRRGRRRPVTGWMEIRKRGRRTGRRVSCVGNARSKWRIVGLNGLIEGRACSNDRPDLLRLLGVLPADWAGPDKPAFLRLVKLPSPPRLQVVMWLARRA